MINNLSSSVTKGQEERGLLQLSHSHHLPVVPHPSHLLCCLTFAMRENPAQPAVRIVVADQSKTQSRTLRPSWPSSFLNDSMWEGKGMGGLPCSPQPPVATLTFSIPCMLPQLQLLLLREERRSPLGHPISVKKGAPRPRRSQGGLIFSRHLQTPCPSPPAASLVGRVARRISASACNP